MNDFEPYRPIEVDEFLNKFFPLPHKNLSKPHKVGKSFGVKSHSRSGKSRKHK